MVYSTYSKEMTTDIIDASMHKLLKRPGDEHSVYVALKTLLQELSQVHGSKRDEVYEEIREIIDFAEGHIEENPTGYFVCSHCGQAVFNETSPNGWVSSQGHNVFCSEECHDAFFNLYPGHTVEL